MLKNIFFKVPISIDYDGYKYNNEALDAVGSQATHSLLCENKGFKPMILGCVRFHGYVWMGHGYPEYMMFGWIDKLNLDIHNRKYFG